VALSSLDALVEDEIARVRRRTKPLEVPGRPALSAMNALLEADRWRTGLTWQYYARDVVGCHAEVLSGFRHGKLLLPRRCLERLVDLNPTWTGALAKAVAEWKLLPSSPRRFVVVPVPRPVDR
jgi:hypothetical protein